MMIRSRNQLCLNRYAFYIICLYFLFYHILLYAHNLPLKFFYYESIANLMFDIRNRTAPFNIQGLFQDISNVQYTFFCLL